MSKLQRDSLQNSTFLVMFALGAYLFWRTLEPIWIPVFLGLTIAVAVFPLLFFLVVVVGSRLVDFLREAADRYQQKGATGLLGDDLSQLLSRFGLDPATVQKRIGELTADVAGAMGKTATTLLAATFSLIFIFIFTALTSYYLLVEGKEGTKWFVEVVPLPDGQMWELVQNVRDVTRAMLVGTGITALYQGVTAFVGYSIFRVESPLVWASLTGIASILPGIGTALVWVPIAIFLMATHHLAAGIGLFAWGAVVVVFVADYILRPKLVGTRIRMNDLLVFIAIFGGVEAFGILGVVMGPIAVAVFLAIVRIYQRDYRPGGPPRAPDVTEPEETALQNAP
ncbi:MAG: AI-2E family transporter [Deltaproteobacteria bacterium]|nr:MAG: AI-2E family transporter [Deltaproteobacteria bacterium]